MSAQGCTLAAPVGMVFLAWASYKLSRALCTSCQEIGDLDGISNGGRGDDEKAVYYYYYYYSVKPAFVAQSDVRSWHIPGCDANSRKQAPLPLVLGGTDYPKCLGGREHTTVQPQGALPAAQGSR